MNVLIVDGQGGRIGKLLTELVIKKIPQAAITCVGTNAMATAAMLKGGAQNAATGENAVCVAARGADFILGPIGILMADALLGEITPAMAVAVAQSNAKKILIPISRCNHLIVGIAPLSLSEIAAQVVDTLEKEIAK